MEPRSRYWIFSPLQDTTFVLLTPLAILSVFAAAGRMGWMDGLLAFGLAMAMAHYLPGILRAYGDRALFDRFRIRLLFAPLILLGVTAGFAYLDLHIVILLALLWGQWHWMMQVYGFARIYDAKSRPEARTPARLDQWMCLLWFGMCVFVINNTLPVLALRFYESGGPQLPPAAFAWFTRLWLGATVVVTFLYAWRMLASIRNGQWPNPLKLAFMIITFAYLAYTVSFVQRPLVGMVMFEMWHDIQYLAIVWVFNINRVQRAPEAGPFIRFLFRPRVALVLAYVALCLAFGSLTHASNLFADETVVRVVLSLVTGTALLHYYLDGFIWKIREKETGQALGVRADADSKPIVPSPAISAAWVRHATLWLLFVVPVMLFFIFETRGEVANNLEIHESLAEAFPDSVDVRYELGRQLVDVGRAADARVHLERAVELAPDLYTARVILGIILGDQGQFDRARIHLEHALSLDDTSAEVHNNLGTILEAQNELASAKHHLERATALNPDYALAHNNLGIVLGKLGEFDRARTHHERAFQIDPQFADAHYQLGLILARMNDTQGAVEQFQRALSIDPYQHLTHYNLGLAFISQGKLPEAKVHFGHALRLEPSAAEARAQLTAIEGEKN